MKPNRPPPAFRAAFFRGHGAAAALRSRAGFTLVELLIVIALLGLLLAMALPSFNGTLQRYRTSIAANQIANALQFARLEAIRTRFPVIVAQDGSPVDCSLPADATDWHCGLKVYGDANSNNAQDTAEPTLKVIPASALSTMNVQINHIRPPGRQMLVFSPLGYISCSVCGGGREGADYFIYVWPATQGNDPTTLPANAVISTICATAGGKVAIFPRYIATSAGNCTPPATP